MYITDALRQCPAIRSSFLHHEQAAAIAAEAYGKLENRPALVFATAGPGVTNVTTGVADAYMDSVPMVILVGDVRSTIRADFAAQRYNAPQEVNQRALLEPIVKEYLCIEPGAGAESIIGEVDRIFRLACTGRPGPVCIALPLDVQGGKFDLDPASAPVPSLGPNVLLDESAAHRAATALASAQRPLLLLGAGVRLARAESAVREVIRRWQVPYCVTIGAVDLQDADDPLSLGCVGPTAQRAANLAFQASDCVIVLGSSFDVSVTGFNVEGLLRNKRLFLVNVDPGEFLRLRSLNLEAVAGDVGAFCAWALEAAPAPPDARVWRDRTIALQRIVGADYERSIRRAVGDGYLSAYDITRRISTQIPQDSVVALGISLDAISVFNAFRVQRGQRIIVSRNLGPMGWDLPAAIGAAHARDADKPLFLITGDGSILLNLQELSVVAGRRIPLCIVVFSNDGYVSIRSTQSNFFGSGYFGCDTASGLHMPELGTVATAFGLEHSAIDDLETLDAAVASYLAHPKPCLIECRLDPLQLREPRLVSRVENGQFVTPTLADMTPSLDAAVRARVLEVLPELEAALP